MFLLSHYQFDVVALFLPSPPPHCPLPTVKMPEMLTKYTWIEICIHFLLPPNPTHGVLIVAYFNLILLHP